MYYFIEPMTEDDIPHVQAIEHRSFSTPWSTHTYRRELRNPSVCRYIVARVSPTPPPPRHVDACGALNRAGIFSTLLSSFSRPPSQPDGNGSAESAKHPIVGYGGLWLMVDEAHITTIAVAPEYRERSLGELLLNNLIDHSFDLQARILTLEVRVSNIVAQNLYSKYGFQVVGKRRRYYTDNGEDALIMSTETLLTPEYQTRIAELLKQLFARLRAQAETNKPPTHPLAKPSSR